MEQLVRLTRGQINEKNCMDLQPLLLSQFRVRGVLMAIRIDVHCVILQYCVVLCSAYSLCWCFKKRCADEKLGKSNFPVVHLWLYRTPRQSKTCFETSYLLLDFCKSKLILNKILFLHTPLQSWFKLLIQLLACAVPAAALPHKNFSETKFQN